MAVAVAEVQLVEVEYLDKEMLEVEVGILGMLLLEEEAVVALDLQELPETLQ